MGKSKTKNQKKSRANAIHLAQEDFGTVPHSFVFHRGQIGKNVSQLIVDMRRVMEPYTAESLKVRKKNVLKDFAAVAGPLGVTHFLIFTKTENSVNLRLARLPRGPTLHFKVSQYSLIKDVVSSLKRHRMHDQQFTHHPLLVLNNFGVPGMHVKLMATMFQNMFPSINVHKVSLNAIKRCVMINYNPETQLIDFRHYSLKVVPVGMSKGIKKLLQEKFPNMSKFEDISELLMKGANLSESEAELDGDHNTTELPQVYAGRGNMKAQQSAVRLIEIGPRMTLQLIKIDEGMCEGNVLYHAIIEKTEAEIQAMLARKQKKLKLKAERKLNQERNVAVKKEQRDENKKRSLEGIKKKLPPKAGEEGDSDAEDPGKEEDQAAADHSEDDEVEYYRQAVGQEPDEDMFPASKRKKGPGKSPHPFKKRKHSSERGGRMDRGPPRDRKPGKWGDRPGVKDRKFGVKKERTMGPKFKVQKGKPRPGFKRKPQSNAKPNASRGFKQKRGKGRQ